MHLQLTVLLFIVSFIAGRRTFSSSSARQADITLTVDGKEVTVPQGTHQLLCLTFKAYNLAYCRFCSNPSLRGRWSGNTPVSLH